MVHNINSVITLFTFYGKETSCFNSAVWTCDEILLEAIEKHDSVTNWCCQCLANALANETRNATLGSKAYNEFFILKKL